MNASQLVQAMGKSQGFTPQQQFILQVGLSPLTGGLGGQSSGSLGTNSNLGGLGNVGMNLGIGQNNPWAGLITTLAALIILDMQMQKGMQNPSMPNQGGNTNPTQNNPLTPLANAIVGVASTVNAVGANMAGTSSGGAGGVGGTGSGANPNTPTSPTSPNGTGKSKKKSPPPIAPIFPTL